MSGLSLGTVNLLYEANSSIIDRLKTRDWYTYEMDFATLVAGANTTGNFIIQNTSDFLWLAGMYFASTAGAAQTASSQVVPLINISITDIGANLPLMSAPVPITSIFGTPLQPYQLLTPKGFRANSQIQATITNFSAATSYDLKLSFIGVRMNIYG